MGQQGSQCGDMFEAARNPCGCKAPHSTAGPFKDPVRLHVATVKPEKAKRPEMASEMSDEDWAYFVSRWEDYKKATALKGDEVIMQLMECCCEHHSGDTSLNHNGFC